MEKIKIAIIGAGASGFGAAEVFRDEKNKNRFDVTIYEKNDYVGGKCRSVLPDGSIANGQTNGFEVGATLIPKHSPSYSDLNDLLDKYGIKPVQFREKDRKTSLYLKNGRQVSHEHPLGKPGAFFKTLRDYDEYATDYLRYSLFKPVGYNGRPRQLNNNLSKLYDKSVYTKFAGAVQGFGYADLADKHLTPALLYYHQYLEPEAIEYPIYKIEGGTQSIWSTVAETYPKGSIKLGEQVLHIERHPDMVRVRTENETNDHDYLIVATPLKPALKFLDFYDKERDFLGKMKYNHYVSVLCKATGQDTISRFNLSACLSNKNIGDVLLTYKRYADSDYIVAYLYLKEGYLRDDESVLNLVETSLDKDIGIKLIDKASAKIYHWDDYFGHLDTKALNSGWYDKFDKYYQGQRRTLYVSSGLHMETVGASFQYATRLAKKYSELWSEV